MKNHNSKFKIFNFSLLIFNLRRQPNGSAMVAVLVIIAIALLVTTTILQNVLIDTDMSFNLKKSDESYNNAISALEEATLRLIREPAFSGTTLNFNDGSVTITIVEISGSEKQINVVSAVNSNRYICQMQALATYNIEGNLTISDFQEIY